MTNEEAVARAEKELRQCSVSLDAAIKRGAPDQDVRNLVTKVNYRRYVVDTLKNAERWERRFYEMKRELEELRGESKPRQHWARTRTRIRPVISTGKDGAETHYPSVTDAAEAVGVYQSSVTRACRTGKPLLGMDWRYADDAD